jgi:putative membrane protein
VDHSETGGKTEVKEETGKTDSTPWKEMPGLVLKGFLMGAADVIPGVSGGTMALILGIYSRLIHAIKSVDIRAIKDFGTLRFHSFFSRTHWRFLISLISGIIMAFIFFTRIVPLPKLMYTYPEPIYGLFFGLILGSIYLLLKNIKSFGWKHFLFLLLGVAIGYWVVTLVPTNTPDNYFFIFFSGAVAICAMILPGISGSFLLLILRKYTFILNQFGKIGGPETVSAGIILLIFVLGMITGIGLFSRLLSWFLDRWHAFTLSVLVGFLVGSLYVIWPFQIRHYTETVRTKIVSVQNPAVQELKKNPENPMQQEYKRLGDIVNPGMISEKQKIQLQTVKKKLIQTEPFWPKISNLSKDNRLTNGRNSFYRAIFSILGGLLLVIFIDWVANKKGIVET